MLKLISSVFFSILFMIFKFFPTNQKKIFFIMTHDVNFNGNVKRIYEQIKEDRPDYKVFFINKKDYSLSDITIIDSIKVFFKIFFYKNYHLATSGIVVLNNIFNAGAYLKFNKHSKVIQVWHGVGSFKKFGEDYAPNDKISKIQRKANRIYTDVIVNSFQDIDVYAKAFNINKEKISVLGSASCDIFFNVSEVKYVKQNIYNEIPQLLGKSIILYAPTFREKLEDNFIIKEYLEKLSLMLTDKYFVLLRLHPHIARQFTSEIINYTNIIDVSNYENVNELMLVSDLLITDYSSLIYEYVLTEKPIIFFAYDLDDYELNRGFYHDYRSFVPGSIIYNINDLIEIINNEDYSNESRSFKYRWHDFFDGHSAKRFIDGFLR